MNPAAEEILAEYFLLIAEAAEDLVTRYPSTRVTSREIEIPPSDAIRRHEIYADGVLC